MGQGREMMITIKRKTIEHLQRYPKHLLEQLQKLKKYLNMLQFDMRKMKKSATIKAQLNTQSVASANTSVTLLRHRRLKHASCSTSIQTYNDSFLNVILISINQTDKCKSF